MFFEVFETMELTRDGKIRLASEATADELPGFVDTRFLPDQKYRVSPQLAKRIDAMVQAGQGQYTEHAPKIQATGRVT